MKLIDSIKRFIIKEKLLDYDTIKRLYKSFTIPPRENWKEYYITVKLYIPSDIYIK